ncbi:MAG: hypothetical protein Kow0081_3700 [Candidatus Dojkabacteria bacterium]
MPNQNNPIQKGLQRVKNYFKDEVEEFLVQNAVYNPKEPKYADVKGFLKNYELELLGAGLNARVFKIKGTKWLVKEARWDLDISIMNFGKIKLPARLAQWFMKIFSFEFLPTEKNILDDYSAYLEFSQYFGRFKKQENFPHPNINLMIAAQKNIRDTLLFFRPAIERKYKLKLDNKIEKILSKKSVKYHNFLPKEYQLLGDSISKENKDQKTSFIFQEFIEGKTLATIPDNKLSTRQKEQLILLIYLILLMHMQIGILPDTKPKNPMINAYNWLTNTDNIMVTRKDLIFIDTRWFWDSNSNFVKRGVLVPDLMINRAKTSLKELLRQV